MLSARRMWTVALLRRSDGLSCPGAGREPAGLAYLTHALARHAQFAGDLAVPTRPVDGVPTLRRARPPASVVQRIAEQMRPMVCGRLRDAKRTHQRFEVESGREGAEPAVPPHPPRSARQPFGPREAS